MKQKYIVCIIILIIAACTSDHKSVATSPLYHADTSYLHEIMRKMIGDHIAPFRPATEYDEETNIFIDTVLYDKDSLKAMALVITENSIFKLKARLSEADNFYSGYYFFCRRDRRGEPLKVFKYNPYRLGRYESYRQVQHRLRYESFTRRSKDVWNDESKYNFDDQKFWSGSEYNEITSDTNYIVIQ